ncbi:D-isomer specific 2-hydroxyacid dehydrogenase family protein [Treponema sp.]|uniref:D-isomer specific 2-hydroxyacid dehydrogenase family protein n=1 Tax=Treponema sp. TaxID=166 RepID=UPI00298DC269|nr:D-isomer specific 2-hydroxyacid dehydrogenase family protein [Treponema sp.]MCQ2241665.1 D-isomer specific 2-hydroxyacid dehydrogenase family protein [Treponema sp.]
MKVFFYCMRDFDEVPLAEKINREFNFEYDWTPEYPSPANYEKAKGYDAISITPCDMSAPVLDAFHALGIKYIVTRSVGFDHFDLKHAAELGIRIGIATYPPQGVANYAIMMMMACARKLPHLIKRSEVQDYTLKGKIGLDISYSTVGIIGTGKIGSTVIKHLSTFGCRLLCCDPYRNPEVEALAEYVDFDTLCRESDIISLHTNATEENHHLLNKAAFDKMKDGVIVVNTSRGKLIDADDLIDAIESGKVGAASLDVLEDEANLYYINRTGDPIKNRQMAILRSFPNVLLTPHTAFYTVQAVENMVGSNFKALKAFEDGAETPFEVKAK